MEHFSSKFVLSYRINININVIIISMYVSNGLENFIPFSEMIYKQISNFYVFSSVMKIYDARLICTQKLYNLY